MEIKYVNFGYGHKIPVFDVKPHYYVFFFIEPLDRTKNLIRNSIIPFASIVWTFSSNHFPLRRDDLSCMKGNGMMIEH